MAPIVSIASLAILATILITVAVNVIKAIFRGLKKSIGSLIAIVLSAIIAAILTLVLCRPESAMMEALKAPIINMLVEAGEIFEIAALQEAVIYYAVMLVAPFFFMISYILISIILSIVISIVIKFVPPFKKPGLLVDRLGGAGVGLVCGFLVSVIVLSPVVGTIGTFVSAGEQVVEEDAEDEFSQLINAASKNTALKIYNNMGCGLLYNMFASVDVNGEKVYLKDDLAVILSLIGTIGTLSGDSEGYSKDQVDALNAMIDDIEKSALIRNVVAAVFSEAAGKWTQGEEFMGMQKISAGEMIDPMIDEMLTVIATTDQTTVTADLRTMADVLGILVESDLMSDSDGEAMLKKLSEGNVTSKLILAINKNERMAPLADQITKISVRTLASTIGIPADSVERYDLLMEDIADSLSQSRGMDYSARLEKVTPEISKALDTYGVDVTDEAVTYVAEGLINDFGDKSYVEAGDVEEFFLVYHVASAADGSASAGGSSIEFLSKNNGFRNENGKVYVGDRALNNYTPDSINDSKAYKYGESKVEICDAKSLYSADSMISTRVTMEDVYDYLGKYADCDDVESEAAKMDEIVAEVVSVFSDYDFDNADSAVVMQDMGSMLDKMSDTNIFGQEAVNNLLKGILQSEKISSTLNLTTKEITEFADDLNNIAAKKDQNYASVTTTVSQTINMIQDVNSDKTKEEKKNNTVQLITNMTEDASRMLGKMVTSSLLTNHGVKETKSGGVSKMVNSLLYNMAAYNGDNKEAEADSVNMIVDFAINDKHDDSDIMFNGEGEEGSLGISADEFVALVADSEVVSKTVVETVSEEGYAENPIITKSLILSEEAKMIAAMDSYYAASGNDADVAVTLNALATFMNIEYTAQ